MDGAGGGAPGWNAEAAARPISARPPAVSRCPAPRAPTPSHPPPTPPPRALRSGAGIAETFPCTRPGNPAGAAAQADPSPALLPAPLPEPTAPGRLSVPLLELLAAEGGGGKKSLQTTPFCGVGSCTSLFSILKHRKEKMREGERRERERGERRPTPTQEAWEALTPACLAAGAVT